MNQIVNMSKYRNRQILAEKFGDSYMYCGWGNRRLGLPTSPLANPYTDKSNARTNRIRVASRDEAVEMYRVWLWQRICSQDQAVLEALHQITPTTALVCWCSPKRCHCEVIARAAAWHNHQTRVIVFGSRSFSDYQTLAQRLDLFLANCSDIAIISGCAKGADQLGEKYATEHGYGLIKVPAQWDVYGKKAGFLRNDQMLDIATHAVGFWDGQSRGTADMIAKVKARGLGLRVIRF